LRCIALELCQYYTLLITISLYYICYIKGQFLPFVMFSILYGIYLHINSIYLTLDSISHCPLKILGCYWFFEFMVLKAENSDLFLVEESYLQEKNIKEWGLSLYYLANFSRPPQSTKCKVFVTANIFIALRILWSTCFYKILLLLNFVDKKIYWFVILLFCLVTLVTVF
jgi:hypothetical protein